MKISESVARRLLIEAIKETRIIRERPWSVEHPFEGDEDVTFETAPMGNGSIQVKLKRFFSS